MEVFGKGDEGAVDDGVAERTEEGEKGDLHKHADLEPVRPIQGIYTLLSKWLAHDLLAQDSPRGSSDGCGRSG